MTEENELSIHDMCERVGRVIAPCRGTEELPAIDHVSHSIMCECAGTGVDIRTLNELYCLVRDVADLAESEASELVTDVIMFSSPGSGAWN